MHTEFIDLFSDEERGIALGGKLIASGELVAFPTETVYGLGANALSGDAARRIFQAKGRPADNPLISHVADVAGALALCEFDERAVALSKAFWPGPLTLVLKKKPVVPDEVTAGLDSAAVRMPDNRFALSLIRAAGVPIAAPSANLSGRPSPTTAKHVMQDMEGRIPLVLSGGACRVGLESTVLSLLTDKAVILRPGGITPDDVAAVIGSAEVAHSALSPLNKGEKAESPGMKYRHYAPDANVVIAGGANVPKTAARLYDEAISSGFRPVILATEQTYRFYEGRECVIIGDRSRPDSLCAALFTSLRDADENGCDTVILEELPPEAMGLAYMNRALRAAGFRVYKS